MDKRLYVIDEDVWTFPESVPVTERALVIFSIATFEAAEAEIDERTRSADPNVSPELLDVLHQVTAQCRRLAQSVYLQARLLYEREQIFARDMTSFAELSDEVVLPLVRRTVFQLRSDNLTLSPNAPDEGWPTWMQLLERLQTIYRLSPEQGQGWISRAQWSSASGLEAALKSGGVPHDDRWWRFRVEDRYQATAVILERIMNELAAKEVKNHA